MTETFMLHLISFVQKRREPVGIESCHTYELLQTQQ
jgi:hypothetical protein